MPKKDDLIVVFGFLYLSLERYRHTPEDAAKEVFENFKKDKTEPSCVQAIKSKGVKSSIDN